MPAKTNYLLLAGDVVCVTLPYEDEYSCEPQKIPLDIAYQSRHVLVINKPAGLVVHPTRSHKEGTLGNAFCGWLQQQGIAGGAFRPVGRLDGDTSGLMICALSPFAVPILNASLQKEYIALVQGSVTENEGRIEAPIGPQNDSVIKQCVRSDGRMGITEYRVIDRKKNASLVKVRTLTGRTHQIRVHFSHLGHPLVGDTLYGGAEDNISRHALHCARLSFLEPENKERTELHIKMPPDMERAISELGLCADKEIMKFL